MIYRTTDPEEIKGFLSADGIADVMGWVDDFEPPIDDDHHYLVVMDGAEKAGMWILHTYRDGLKIHAAMLPTHRGAISVKALAAVVEYAFHRANVIYAEISKDLPHVVRFAERGGFYHLSETGGKVLLEKRSDQWVAL